MVDHLSEPRMQPGGALSEMLGGWLSTGAGAGMALLMVVWGLVGVRACLVPYLLPVVRQVEVTIPGYDSALAQAARRPARAEQGFARAAH